MIFAWNLRITLKILSFFPNAGLSFLFLQHCFGLLNKTQLCNLTAPALVEKMKKKKGKIVAYKVESISIC